MRRCKVVAEDMPIGMRTRVLLDEGLLWERSDVIPECCENSTIYVYDVVVPAVVPSDVLCHMSGGRLATAVELARRGEEPVGEACDDDLSELLLLYDRFFYAADDPKPPLPKAPAPGEIDNDAFCRWIDDALAMSGFDAVLAARLDHGVPLSDIASV